MNDLRKVERTRRNIIKMGAILSFAALQNVSKTDPASANCGKNGKLWEWVARQETVQTAS